MGTSRQVKQGRAARLGCIDLMTIADPDCKNRLDTKANRDPSTLTPPLRYHRKRGEGRQPEYHDGQRQQAARLHRSPAECRRR